jgi:hypothetical protein
LESAFGAENLEQGISEIVVFPQSVNLNQVQHSLRRQLEINYLCEFMPIDAGSANEYRLIDLVKESYPALKQYQYLEAMVADVNLPDVLLVTNLENCSADQQEKWIKDITRWAEACRSSGAKHPIVLLTTYQSFADSKLPADDVRLSIRVWEGIPSALEARLLFRVDVPDEFEAKALWREAILSSLSGNDLELAEFIADVVFKPLDQIINQLRQYAIDVGWSKEVLENNLRTWRPDNSRLKRPHNQVHNLYSKGVIIQTPENGEEVHSSALALMGKDQEIHHRLWRGQTALIMPMVDEVRLRICNAMIRKHGDAWAGRVDEKNPTFPELGKIKLFFDRSLCTVEERKQWMNIIKSSYHIRNELAHYRIIPFLDFQGFWPSYRHVRKALDGTGYS